MVLDERARHQLFLRLEEVLGAQPAETLMEMMPPVGWADVATKRDLDQGLELLKHELLAAFRGELLNAITAQTNIISAQTRTLVLANLGAVLSTAALVVGAAKFT
jgi:hypothetical protein